MTGEHVFISYNHDDADAVDRFASKLKASGISYFRDVEARNFGQDLSQAVREQLESATYVVAFMSHSTQADRDWVIFEIGIAYSLRRTIVLRLLDQEVKVPSYLANVRYMQTDADEAEFLALLLDQPLFGALKARNHGHVRELLASGASLSSRDEEGNTPLICASVIGDAKAVELLLDAGSDVNAGNKDHWTALHCAATFGHLDAVQALVEHGAEVNADRHVTGMTPFDMAQMRGQVDVGQFLRAHGGRSRWEAGGPPVDMGRFFPPA